MSKKINSESLAVKIVVIDKKLLEELAPYFCKSIISAFFEPVNILSVTKNRLAFFISNSKFMRSRNSLLFEKGMAKHIAPFIRKDGKNRYKIKGDIEAQGQSFYEQYRTELFNAMKIKTTIFHSADRCYIPGESSIFLNKINGKWYKFRDAEPCEMLPMIFGKELSRMIKYSLLRGLITIQNAESEKDVGEYNCDRTVRLIKK